MKRLLQQQDFKTLFDSTLDAIMVADDNRVYLAANKAACKLLKATEAQILGRNISDFLTPERRQLSETRWSRFLREGQIEGELEMVCLDGSRCFVEFRSRANFVPGQHLSVMRDVTERHQAEQELLESNRQIISIMESVSDIVLAFDHNWNFLYANPQSEPILLRARHEVIGKNLWQEFPETIGTVFEAGYRRAARDGVPVHFQGFVPSFDAWLEVHVYPSSTGVTVYLRDINDRKRGEDNLRFLSEAGATLASSLDYDCIIDNLAELAISYIADWCAIDVLEGGEIKRLSVRHKDPAKLEIAHEFQKRYPPRLDEPTGVPQVMRTGEAQLWPEVSDELLAQTAPDPYWLETMRYLGLKSVILVPLTARGQTIGAMTLVRERSGRPYTNSDLVVAQELARRASGAVENGRLFRDMERALRTAEDASRARDEFLAIVSHELKTPMTPILGWIGILKDGISQTDPQTLRHAMEVIERNVHSQSQLVNDLLDISRIVTGKLRLNIKPIILAEVVAHAVETVRPAADAKSVEIVVRVEEGLPAILADGERLQQVVWNLLSNAIKFTPKAGIVVVSVRAVEGCLEVEVRDTGQGMSRDFLPYVFDRFRQADSSSTREHGGLGLGLSIVRNLVELHGGTVSVDSPGVGLGATFCARFPVQAVDAALRGSGAGALGGASPRETDAVESSGLLSAAKTLAGMRVLVIEDMDDSRELLATLLRHQGAEVREANGARTGMTILLEWRPDVILSDIGMPEEDGYSFIKRVRALPEEQGGQTPAVALTAYGRLEDRLQALASGFQNHIVKPAELRELTITLASVTGRATGG
ncbi:MAG TPA: ATP-binding protein [Abditibacterium sp.]|jgi:PAS domain S-box-containing protein